MFIQIVQKEIIKKMPHPSIVVAYCLITMSLLTKDSCIHRQLLYWNVKLVLYQKRGKKGKPSVTSRVAPICYTWMNRVECFETFLAITLLIRDFLYYIRSFSKYFIGDLDVLHEGYLICVAGRALGACGLCCFHHPCVCFLFCPLLY